MGSASVLVDMQGSGDSRGIAIDRVGIKGVRHPASVRTEHGVPQRTVATFDMYVDLPSGVKGTHMSRFLETLAAVDVALDGEGMSVLMQEMLTRLHAAHGHIDVSFPFFILKAAPVSGVRSLMDYEVTLGATHAPVHGTLQQLAVRVPVTSLCPCSKEISRYGAHNQRSHITIAAELQSHMAIEELVRIAERAASCELFGLLKRPDEKYVTERAYENPKFVEDLVRDLAVSLDAEPSIRRYQVSAENFESIHNHSAYARIERGERVMLEQRSLGDEPCRAGTRAGQAA